MGVGVDEDVLGLDVSVADALGVDVGDGAEELVGVELDEDGRHHLLHLEVLLHDAVDGLGDVVHDHVQVHFVRLLATCQEVLAHLDAVGVVQHFQNLQFSVLVALVLEHLLDGHGLARLSDRGLEHHAEGALTDDLLRVVGEALLLLLRRRSERT